MNKPRLLDVCCCAGGGARGYQQAGYDVTGIDIRPQPHYVGDRFVQAEGLAYLREHGQEFDLIHVSPPCQGYSAATRGKHKLIARLIVPFRQVLQEIGKPYVIENVVGAKTELNASLLLCGSMFGLPIARHRLFELSHMVLAPGHIQCAGLAGKYARSQGWDYRDMWVAGKGRHIGIADRWRQIMGIDWFMTQHEITEAIPPSFTEFIGQQLWPIIA